MRHKQDRTRHGHGTFPFLGDFYCYLNCYLSSLLPNFIQKAMTFAFLSWDVGFKKTQTYTTYDVKDLNIEGVCILICRKNKKVREKSPIETTQSLLYFSISRR